MTTWPPGMEPAELPPIPESKPQPVHLSRVVDPGPIDIHITMDTEIGDPELDPETGQCIGPGATITQLIVEQAVTRILHDGVIREQVVNAVIAAAQMEIADQVRVIVVDALTEPFQVTDRWGAKTGKPITIQDQIAEEIKAQLQLAKRSDYRNEASTTISDIIKSEVDTALRNELNEAVREARTVVVGAVRSKAADMIGEVVISALKR